MTEEQLEARATLLEYILDNSYEPRLPEVEEELCSIYKMLNVMETL